MRHLAILLSLAILMALSACVEDAATPIPQPTVEITPSPTPALTPALTPPSTRTPLPTSTPLAGWSAGWEHTAPTPAAQPTQTPTVPSIPPTPGPTAVVEMPVTPGPETTRQQCFDLLHAIDEQRIAEAEAKSRRYPPRLANDDLVGTCVASVQQGYDLETVVGWFADIDFSTNLNNLAAALNDNDEQQSAQRSTVVSDASTFDALDTFDNLVTFKCTGSMEPTITCEHIADGTVPSSQGDIGVGDIIVFDSPGNCLDGLIAHRIIDVRTAANGDHVYQTKGDATAKPDSCLVPFSAVRLIITDIRLPSEQDVRVANLRKQVNAARDAYESALARANELAAAADAIADEVNRGDAAFEVWERAKAEWERAYARYKIVLAAYNCWLEHARNDNYDGSC